VRAEAGDSIGPYYNDFVAFTLTADAVGTFYGMQLTPLGASGPYVLTITQTPEPATYALLLLGGLIAVVGARRRS
jgi:hypothetical protein